MFLPHGACELLTSTLSLWSVGEDAQGVILDPGILPQLLDVRCTIYMVDRKSKDVLNKIVR